MLQFSNFMHVFTGLSASCNSSFVSLPTYLLRFEIPTSRYEQTFTVPTKTSQSYFHRFFEMTYYSSMVSEENLFVGLKSKIPCELPFLFSHLVVSRWMSIASAVGCIGCSNQSFCVTAFIPKAGGYLCD